MPTYRRFEELPVWKVAAELYLHTDAFLENAGKHLRLSARDQLERAVLSVSNNIAEGFERGTTNELLAFIYIARGSAGEVRSMLTLLARKPGMMDFKSEISNLITLAESCSRQLQGWAESLQNSSITGPRHLNAQTRESYQKKQARESGAIKFHEMLAKTLPPGHPARPK